MNQKEKELREQLQKTLTTARDIAAKAEKEDRDFTAEEGPQVKAALDEAHGIKESLKKFEDEAEMKRALDAFGESVDLLGKSDEVPSAGVIHSAAKGSLGQQFVDSPEFKNWLKTIAPNGRIPDSTKGIQSPPLQFKGLKEFNRKALITGASETSAGALTDAQFLGLQDMGTFMRPLTIRDVITNGTTNTDAVEYVRVNTTTNAAAPVAEATATAGASGLKPESDVALAKVTATVKTIAHWLAATKRALSDAGQLRTLIDGFLRYGLEEEVEDQMMTGDGTGENFTGIANVSGVQTQAKGTDSLIVQARKARTKVLTVGRARPNAYILNPADWEKFDLLTDNEQRYYFGGPLAMGTPRLWGVPVIESEATPAGTGYVGDFRTCVLWDREQAAITVSDSHSDFFIRNMVAILAELRAAFGVFRPAAIVKLTGIV